MLRKIIKIDQTLCNGCGLCASSCAENAITIENGKAVLAAENLCDGLGACLGECPFGAISIEEREADAFDEVAVERRLETQAACDCAHSQTMEPVSESARFSEHGGGCPGSCAMVFEPRKNTVGRNSAESRQSQLGQWPIQLALVSVTASCFQGADLLITADCAPAVCADYHESFLRGKAMVMGCPKLDDNNFYQRKLIELFAKSDIKSVTVLRMEVSCCGGMSAAARMALNVSGKKIPYREIIIDMRGDVVSD